MSEAGYLTGFGNHFASEAVPGALPVGRNSPQHAPFGLYAEQLSGTAFTAPRAENRRSWLYRLRPAANHPAFVPYGRARQLRAAPFDEVPPSPNRLRWDPLPWPAEPTDFVDGLVTYGGNGAAGESGIAVHLYAATAGMGPGRALANADGELLIVPQEGTLDLVTELGRLAIAPGQIALVPRGVRCRIDLADGRARGYVCENAGAPFRLPDLGPIGANGLANPRDFETPVAWFEDRDEPCEFELDREIRRPEIVVGAASIIHRSMSSRGTATSRRAATICAASTRSAPSRSIIRTRRSSPCSPRRPTRRAPPIATS